MPHDPTPADFTSDLAALEHRQSLLHAALAHVQALGATSIGEHGLAIYHRLAILNGEHSIEAVLVHAAGGEISSGFLPVDPHDHATIRQTQRLTSSILLAALESPDVPTPQQAQRPAPMPPMLQQEPLPAAAKPEPEPEPEPEAPAAEPEPPNPDEVAALLAELDALHKRSAASCKLLVNGFKLTHNIGRAPFAQSITTRERADWLREQIDQVTAELDLKAEVTA
jgi:hypothetical protein